MMKISIVNPKTIAVVKDSVNISSCDSINIELNFSSTPELNSTLIASVDCNNIHTIIREQSESTRFKVGDRIIRRTESLRIYTIIEIIRQPYPYDVKDSRGNIITTIYKCSYNGEDNKMLILNDLVITDSENCKISWTLKEQGWKIWTQ
jgi:hypothetical protein